ncbi:MAG: DUF4249 family protein [Bacteroidota bacterium]
MKSHPSPPRVQDLFKKSYLFFLLLTFGLSSCLDPIDLDPPDGLEDALVVQAILLKGQPNRIDVKVDRLFNFDLTSFTRVTPLAGFIVDEDGNRLELEGRGEGILRLDIPDDHPDFPIKYSRSYKIELQMPNGSVIVSSLEPLIPVTRIDSIHSDILLKFVPDPQDRDQSVLDTFLRFSVDTQLKLEDQEDYARFRWFADRTFKFTELTQFDPPQDTCYITEATDLFQPRLFDANVLKNDYLNKQTVFDQRVNFKLAEGYVFSLFQESLSEGAFIYWSQIDQLLNRTGDMFETPAGIPFTNISYTDEREERLYGYFYCTERDTLRKYIPPSAILPPQNSLCPQFEGEDEFPDICIECEQEPRTTTSPPPFWITGASFFNTLLLGL